MSDKMVESILQNLPSELLTEDVKKEVHTLLEETVNSRVEAKEELLKEEYEAKEKELTESFTLKEEKLKTQMEENERVLLEEAEKHKKELEDITIEETKQFKDRLTQELAEESSAYREDVEAMVLEEAKALKESQDTALVEEVKKFRSEMVEKVSDYIEAQLEQSIPEEMMEAVAKLELYEPLIEQVKQAFTNNYIKLDSTSYELIKEARDENASLKGKLQESEKDKIRLKKEMKEVERNMKVEGLTEGLTAKQKSRAIKLLEGVDVEDLETRFETIRDIVIENEKQAPKRSSKKPEAKKVRKLSESKKKEPKADSKEENVVDDEDDEIVRHQVKKVINESTAREQLDESRQSNLPAGASPLMNDWAQKVSKARNRN